MATIPDVTRERVSVQPSMDVARHESGIMGRAFQQVGRAVSGLGADISAMAARERERLDDARADEAKNRYRQKLLDLTMGQPEPGKDDKGGYVNLQGAAWVTPAPDGAIPMDQYRKKSTTGRDSVVKDLGLSGRALEKFNAFAANADLDFQAGLLRHALRESDSYYKQTFDSTIKSETLNAGANWNNPVAVVESMRRISEATQREAERLGIADVASAQQEALAGVHEAVVDSALREGNAKFAEEHLGNFKDAIPAKTALTLNNKVQKLREQQIALGATDKVMRALTPRMMPSEYDRARGLVSGPAHDTKLDFGILLKKHSGDVEKAWAAHKVGTGVVAEAEAQAAKSERDNKKDPNAPVKSWLDFVPKETRTYVADNAKMFAAGGGVTEPTLAEVKDMAHRQVLVDNPLATGEQVEAAKAKAEQWFNDLRATRSQAQDNALLDVQQRVDAGKIRSYHDLTPQDMSLLGGKRTAARAYIEGAQGDQDKLAQASPAAREQYDRLMSSPDVLKDFPAATIMSLTPELGQKWVNDLLSRKQDYLTNPEKFTAARIDADLFEATVEPFLRGVSRSAAAIRKHEIRQRVEAEIGRRRANGETGLSIDKDKPSIIAKYAMKYPVEKPGLLFGTNIEMMPGTAFPSAEQVPLAPEETAKIRAKATKLGLTNLSDSDILRVYRMTKAAEAAK